MAPHHCCFCLLLFLYYLFPPRGWVQPFLGISDCKSSNFLRDHNFIHDPLSDRKRGVTLYSYLIPAQWWHITVTMVYCFFSYFFVSSSRMGATTHYDHWLHMKYISEWSYYGYIPLLDRLRGFKFYSDFIPEKWRRITVTTIFWVLCSEIIQHYLSIGMAI